MIFVSSKLIEVNNLVKKYKKAKAPAVNDVSFSVDDGKFFAFLGPNGAGKTTTISILTTTLSKTSGEVKIAGYDINKQAKEVRQLMGIIFQNPSLDLNLTAEENIRLHALLYNLYPFRPVYALMPKEYKDRVNELAELLGIKDALRKPVKTFSGGMKRKLEILRSLMHKPKVLFLDEPTTGLDPASRRNLWEYLQVVRKQEGTTIFLTTHYLEEAEGADTVAIINEGKIVAQGSPAEIKHALIEDYVLVDGDNRDKLKKELAGLKLNVEMEEDGLHIKMTDGAEEAKKIIQQIKSPLTKLEIHTPTLETAYLEVLNQDNNQLEAEQEESDAN